MPEQAESPPTRVVELMVNLDDATGEAVGHAIDRLMARGALDAWAAPITMKKGRPGVTLSVLAAPEDRDRLALALLRATGSFGVRFRDAERVVLDRAWHERPTRLGGVTLKAGSLGGEAVVVKPEFDSVLALARSAGVDLPEAQGAAKAAADALLGELKRAGPGRGGGQNSGGQGGAG